MTTICIPPPGEARIGEKERQATAASAQISQPLSRARTIFFFFFSLAQVMPLLLTALNWQIGPSMACHVSWRWMS